MRGLCTKFFLTMRGVQFIIAGVGDVAQLGEHQVRNLGVKGSNPSVSTNTEIFKAEVNSFRFLRLRKKIPVTHVAGIFYVVENLPLHLCKKKRRAEAQRSL